MNSERKFRWLLLVILGALAASGAYFGYQTWQTPAKNSTDPSAVTDPLLPTRPVSRPPTPPDGYVGSAACGKCHDEICKTFAQHPMGKSAALTPGDADLEDFSPAKAEFTAKDGTRYKVEKVGDQVLHHEIGTDPQGRVVYDQAVAVSLAIGSGTRGKTYAANHNGILLQSPISWYGAKGGYFELSPGYENSSPHPRFSRRLVEECLVCHVGRMEFDPETPDRLAPPYFHEISIGCERCHGPGERHVAAQQAGITRSPDSTIVNPARLPMRERESVCYQCHLHGAFRTTRYGRHERDFRPGMAMEEIFGVLTKEESNAGGPSKAVSQVEQMWTSACFRRSAGKMGCISCHNPHEWPGPEKREDFYRARCNTCHAERGCSLPSEKRSEKHDSCITCHMPRNTAKDIVHASQTDHRVLKDPAILPEPAPETDNKPEVKFFDLADARLPHWEVLRIRGLGKLSGREGVSGPQEAAPLLLPLARVAPDDVPLLHALGAHYLSQRNYVQAQQWLQRANAVEPKNEAVLSSLALACYLQRDLANASKYCDQVIELNPYLPRHFALQAEILAALGKHDEALAAAQKAAELDPSDTQLRDRLQAPDR